MFRLIAGIRGGQTQIPNIGVEQYQIIAPCIYYITAKQIINAIDLREEREEDATLRAINSLQKKHDDLERS